MEGQTEKQNALAAEAQAQDKPNLLAQAIENTMAASPDMQNLRYAAEAGRYFAASGYWADLNIASKAAVKIMYGQALGVSAPVAAASIHVGKSGKPSLSGELIGALMKRAGYSWKFIEHTATVCEIACYQDGKRMLDEHGKGATVRFTYDDAKKAGLTEPFEKAASMYDKYGMDMLFNRTLVRFQRRFAPEVTAGMVIHTPDELEEIERKDMPNMAGVREGTSEDQREIAKRKVLELRKEKPEPVADEKEPEPEAPAGEPVPPAPPTPAEPRPVFGVARRRA